MTLPMSNCDRVTTLHVHIGGQASVTQSATTEIKGNETIHGDHGRIDLRQVEADLDLDVDTLSDTLPLGPQASAVRVYDDDLDLGFESGNLADF